MVYLRSHYNNFSHKHWAMGPLLLQTGNTVFHKGALHTNGSLGKLLEKDPHEKLFWAFDKDTHILETWCGI